MVSNEKGSICFMTDYEYDQMINRNHVATPRSVVEQIYGLINIKQFKQCWFPFNNYDSEFKLKADELNLRYKATHLFDNLRNDFFKIDPPDGCDLMISNPPFNIQNDIIKRSFDLVDTGRVKAFVLLLPLSTLETPSRAAIYEKYADKLSLIIFKKRIKFLNKKTSFNTACCWVCYNIPSLKKISWI